MGCVGEGRIGGMGMDSVMKLPTATLSCLAGLLSYLKEFKLDQVPSPVLNAASALAGPPPHVKLLEIHVPLAHDA
eukprot:2170107-Rhodomonas_salina.2